MIRCLKCDWEGTAEEVKYKEGVPICPQCKTPLENLCPNCGADWSAVAEGLREEPRGDNYWTAYWIVQNCSVCRLNFMGGSPCVSSPAK